MSIILHSGNKWDFFFFFYTLSLLHLISIYTLRITIDKSVILKSSFIIALVNVVTLEKTLTQANLKLPTMEC